MIVANRKSLEEILNMLKPYKKVLLLGCNECVTVCAAGGEREVGVLASELRLSRSKEGQEIEIKSRPWSVSVIMSISIRCVLLWGTMRSFYRWPVGRGFSMWRRSIGQSQFFLRSIRAFLGLPWSRGYGVSVVRVVGSVSCI